MEDQALEMMGERQFAQRKPKMYEQEKRDPGHVLIQRGAEGTIILGADFKLSNDGSVEPGFSTTKSSPSCY